MKGAPGAAAGAAAEGPEAGAQAAGKPHYAGARAILAASIGNALEWYDFSVYAFFAIYISRNVFPNQGSAAALINAFLIYGVAFVARPVGAVLLGAYGGQVGAQGGADPVSFSCGGGRCVLPSRRRMRSLVSAAPLLILCGRLLQGLSAAVRLVGQCHFWSSTLRPSAGGRMQRGCSRAWGCRIFSGR